MYDNNHLYTLVISDVSLPYINERDAPRVTYEALTYGEALYIMHLSTMQGFVCAMWISEEIDDEQAQDNVSEEAV